MVLIGPVPQWQPSRYKLILKKYWGAVPQRLNHHLCRSEFDTEERYGNSTQLTYIPLVDRLCNTDDCLTHLELPECRQG